MFLIPALLAAGPNLLVNGDFERGNAGFTTTYKYVAPAKDALYPESNYTLARHTREPDVLNTVGIADYKDHTSGKGLFFLVNGAKNRNSLVWEQTVRGLTVGDRYRFTQWVSRWTPNQGVSAKLSIIVDDVEIDTYEDPSVAGKWMAHSVSFAATSESMVLQIRNLESALHGNDFALDDLSLVADRGPSGPPPPR